MGNFSEFFSTDVFFEFIGDDEFLGRVTIDTGEIAEQCEIKDMKSELEGEGVKHGEIFMSLSWLTTSKDKSVLQGKCQYYQDLKHFF